MAKASKKSEAKAGVGHNSGGTSQMDDDQLQGLTRQHAQKRAKLLETEKKAKADRMNFDKVIKSDLGPKGLSDIKLLEKLETPEGEAEIKAEIDRQIRVARWAGLSVGTQASLFGEDRRPIEERAAEDGKRAGLAGKDCDPPHAAGTEAREAWIANWHEGQAVLATGFKQKEPEAAVIKSDKKKTGPDEFDASADGGAPTSEGDPENPWPDDKAIAANAVH